MSDRPLVSVLTPTWRRHELLAIALENVREQAYRPLEHVIVVDGPDDDATWRAIAERAASSRMAGIDTNAVELGRNWSTVLHDSYCAAPMQAAMFLARGDYQCWLADDERMAPDHVASLVDALEASGADFAYGRVRMHRAGQAPEHGYEIGADPPERGQITNVLYRAELLTRGLYVFGDDRASDWATISRWIRNGATWAYVPRVTLTHRIDR